MPQLIAQVCATGVGLHLDDFGTGYSSLSSLHQLPVQALKIDRGFVAALDHEDGSAVIVRSTIALAHSLGMRVIGEGIEQKWQLDRLRDLGCDLGQGFLFSPALDADGAGALLRDWTGTGAPTGQLLSPA